MTNSPTASSWYRFGLFLRRRALPSRLRTVSETATIVSRTLSLPKTRPFCDRRLSPLSILRGLTDRSCACRPTSASRASSLSPWRRSLRFSPFLLVISSTTSPTTGRSAFRTSRTRSPARTSSSSSTPSTSFEWCFLSSLTLRASCTASSIARRRSRCTC